MTFAAIFSKKYPTDFREIFSVCRLSTPGSTDKKYALKLEHFRYMGDKTCEKTAIGRLSANVRILERAEGVPVDPITL